MPHWQKRLQQPLANADLQYLLLQQNGEWMHLRSQVFCLQEVDELWASKLHSHFQRRGWHFAPRQQPTEPGSVKSRHVKPSSQGICHDAIDAT